jgi:hypothetical protein
MTFALIALLISWEIGWFALAILWPRTREQASDVILRGALAGGLGFAISSVLYLACLVAGVAQRPWVVGVEVAALIALATLARRIPPPDETGAVESPDSDSRFDWLLRGGVLVALIVNANAWWVRFKDEPLGFWDAFAIWNLKARFFFVDSGEHWQRAFSNSVSWSHTDYPLLLPLNVARLWTYAGEPTQEVSVVLSVIFALLVAALLYGVVSCLADAALGTLAVYAVLATPALMAQSTWQVADIPLAFFLAAAAGLVLIADKIPAGERPALVVSGLFAGAAAWTKNEGLLFALAIPIAMMFVGSRSEFSARIQRTGQFAKGLAVPVAILFLMKVTLAGENDLADDFAFNSLTRVFEIDRHAEILASFARALATLCGLPLLVSLATLAVWLRLRRGDEANRNIAAITAALLLQLGGYYFIYLITERDLAWHLGTSNLRLFVQLWPTALLLLFVGLRSFGKAGYELGIIGLRIPANQPPSATNSDPVE